MLHEILCYVLHLSDEQDSLDLLNCQEFLHPGEEQLLKRIYDIAKDYLHLNSLIVTYTNESATNNPLSNCIMPGLYVKEFCNGVNEVLQEYRDNVVEIEHIVLQNPQLTITYVLYRLEKYIGLFSHLKLMLNRINTEKTHGCLLIGFLQNFCNNGIETVVAATNTIQIAVNSIFYRQLRNWLIFGDLVDEFGEFFIVKTSKLEKSPDESLSKSISEQKHLSLYQINIAKLPDVITLELAESVLFIGQMVFTVISKDKSRDVWQGESLMLARKIQDLEKVPFNLIELTTAVNLCQTYVSSYMWQLIVHEAKLHEHLNLVRNYYCLGQGELFKQFTTCLKSNTLQSNSRLNTFFHETAQKLYGENDTSHTRFTIQEKFLSFKSTWPLDILIFNADTIMHYNNLFQFLLRIQQTQSMLHQLWSQHRKRKSSSETFMSTSKSAWVLRHKLQLLVDNLQYYLQVDVIECQFSKFSQALENLKSTRDVTSVHSRFLSTLLSQTFVLNQIDSDDDTENVIFTEERMVYETICRILNKCDSFCTESKYNDGELNCERLNEFQKSFSQLMVMLLKILYNLHEKLSNGHHLLQLLHRLDFNLWYSAF